MTLVATALLIAAGVAEPAAAPAHYTLKITGLLFDGVLPGDPEPEECVRIENVGSGVVDLSEVYLSDRHGPERRTEGGHEHQVKFPPGTKLRPDQEVWVAHQAEAFARFFGRAPDFEVESTLDSVPKMLATDGWPNFPATRGVASLHGGQGAVIDLVAYEKGESRLDAAAIPSSAWHGDAILLDRASMLGWKGQILARDRSAGGGVLPDTDTAADWDSGFSRTRLGVDPIHRVEYPGQTRFSPWPLESSDVEITAASAPDNQFAVLSSVIDAASEEIRVRIYQFENDHIADRLVAALGRGVKVTVYLEGSPVGGIPDQERWITGRLERAGAKIWFLISDAKKKIRARYKFDHSKYILVDHALAMIATENFGYTGFPVEPTFGNRGWSVFIKEPRLVRALSAVWDADLKPGLTDLVAQEASLEDQYGPPFKETLFTVFRAVRTGKYRAGVEPLRFRGKAGLELVLCPDNCLSEESGVIGLIKGARETLEIVQNSLPLWWGPKATGTIETTPNLPLMAAIQAARRGVKTRVLIDGTWYNTEEDDPRDNDDAVRTLNALAKREKLPLVAKVVNLGAAELEKIHAKGVIADGRRTLIGSMNWTESSFKANREVAVIVDQREVASYYQALFERDWIASRLYSVSLGKGGAKARLLPARDSKVLRKYSEGDILDVVGEMDGALEVRLDERRTGFVDKSTVAEIVTASDDARMALGQVAAISGRIKSVHKSNNFAALNFGEDWKIDFSVYLSNKIYDALCKKVGSPDALEGRQVTVRGKVVEKNGPAINVSKVEQVSVK